MKQFATIATLGLALANAQSIFELIVGEQNLQEVNDSFELLRMPISQSSSQNNFGCMVDEAVFEGQYREKTITAPLVPFHLDYSQQERFISRATDFHKNLDANGSVPIYTCDDREPGAGDDKSAAGLFFPVFAAEVSRANPTGTFAGKCFEEITFAFEQTSETTFDVVVTTDKPKSHLCNDTVLFANTEIQHFEVFYFKGTHKISFKMNTPEA